MPLTAVPTFNRFAGRLGWRKTVGELSVKTWTIAPGCSRTDPPCLYDEADLARVTGYGLASSAAVEQPRLRGGRLEHGASTASLLRNVTLLQGRLFRPGMTYDLSHGPVPWVGRTPQVERERAVLAATHFGCRYFGHWICDDLPLRIAARALGDAVMWEHPQTEHQRAYERALGLEIEALGDTLFHELVVIDDWGQNDYKRERWHLIRSRMGCNDPAAAHEGVMYLRGSSGERRRLLNEDAVAESLRRRGFRIASPADQSYDELVALGRGARVVVSVEGSQNAHGLMAMADGGTMIALQPPDRFNNVYKDRCDCLGLRYGFVVGHPGEGGGFTVDTAALNRLLDRVTFQG